ncbi:hypothetical protein ACRQ5D_04930 [Mucilaginibacter sp. P25]|uniref:hypothetical protein n=1 Tax=Mucilaginibacter sp. P25 TaxID=3423945 RepID=UPI003D7A51C0
MRFVFPVIQNDQGVAPLNQLMLLELNMFYVATCPSGYRVDVRIYLGIVGFFVMLAKPPILNEIKYAGENDEDGNDRDNDISRMDLLIFFFMSKALITNCRWYIKGDSKW